ncbi:MAG: DUF6427 family protein [Flavobacteriales bacterium]
MFTRIFRSNNPANAFYLIAALVLLWIIPMYAPVSFAPRLYPAPLQKLTLLPAGWAWLRHLLVLALIAASAIVFNLTVDKYKLLAARNYMVAFYFVVVSYFFPALHIAAALFLSVLNIDCAFGMFHSSAPRKEAFLCGLILAAAFLFYPPAALLLLFSVFAIFILSVSSFRHLFILLIGFLLPCLYYGVWLFWTDRLDAYMENAFIFSHMHTAAFLELKITTLAPLALASLLVLLAIPPCYRQMSTCVISVKKMYSLLLLCAALSLSMMWFAGSGTLPLLFALAPFALFFTIFLQAIKRTFLAEAVLCIFIALGIFKQLADCGLLSISFPNFTP